MEEEKIIIDKWFDKKLSISIGRFFIITTLLLLIFFVTKLSISRNISASRDNENGLEISKLIRKVKLELMKADTERINNNEHALFKLKDFRMEISFTVRSVNKAGAKVDYKFVTIENDAATANENVQKLMLHWDAIPPKKIIPRLDTTISAMNITTDSSIKIDTIK